MVSQLELWTEALASLNIKIVAPPADSAPLNVYWPAAAFCDSGAGGPGLAAHPHATVTLQARLPMRRCGSTGQDVTGELKSVARGDYRLIVCDTVV